MATIYAMILTLGTTPSVQQTMIFAAVKLDAVNRAAKVKLTSAGKSINVARTLHTLGRDVLATGFLGGDSGKLIRQELGACGIAHDFLEVLPRTRTCITMIDQRSGQATELVEETVGLPETDYQRLLELLMAKIGSAEALVLSGSLPPGAAVDFYGRCVQAAKGARIPVVLDGRGGPLLAALEYAPTVVKPNRQELAETVGFAVDSDAKLRQGLRQLLECGPRWAIVTMGQDGAMAADRAGFWRVDIPRVKAVSPIGSGDAFAAGVAASLVDGADLPTALKLGAACGVANCLNCPAGHGRRQDIDRMLSQVRVEKV